MSRAAHKAYEGVMAALGRKDLAQARPLIETLLKRRPRDAELRHNLAGGLLGAGDAGGAMVLLAQALAIRPAQRVSAEMLSAQLSLVSPAQVLALDPRGLVAALDTQDVDPQPLARTAVAWMIEADATRGGLADIMNTGRQVSWAEAARALLDRLDVLARPKGLLLRALSRGINTDLEFERLLTGLRRHLLLSDTALDFSDRTLTALVLALLAQAHNNEHIWPREGAEEQALAAFELDPAALRAGDVSALRVLVLHGLYGPIHDLAAFAQGAGDLSAVWPADLAEFVRGVVESRRQQAEVAAALPDLGPIEDAVSAGVAAQYEANPYPRWQALKPARPGSLRARLAEHVPPSRLGFFDRPFDVLVAGCGTGREAIQTAFACAPHGRVLAIDLSRASLAYGAMAARRYDAPPIEFARGDILNLPDFERRFEIIVCSGVLHHLGDPLAGWRALLRLLRPEGVMRVGLYSRLARRDVARVRAIMGAEPPRIPDEVRAARSRLIETHWDELDAQFQRARDFYSTSGCRDLFFHEQEHQFTIPEIRQALEGLDLGFRGFALPGAVRDGFRRWAPPGTAMTDLDAWWRYEQERPETFAGMYQFWCRQRDAASLTG